MISHQVVRVFVTLRQAFTEAVYVQNIDFFPPCMALNQTKRLVFGWLGLAKLCLFSRLMQKRIFN